MEERTGSMGAYKMHVSLRNNYEWNGINATKRNQINAEENAES